MNDSAKNRQRFENKLIKDEALKEINLLYEKLKAKISGPSPAGDPGPTLVARPVKRG